MRAKIRAHKDMLSEHVRHAIACGRDGRDPVDLYESYGFPSSNHPGVVNVAYCGGQVDTLAENVDPRVYSMLMTSNRNRSTLVDANGTQERKLPEPSSSDY